MKVQGTVTTPVTKKQQAWALRQALESEPRHIKLTEGQRRRVARRPR